MSIGHAILGILIDGDRHGYDIAGTLATRIGGGPYNSGQVHQALESLEERGLAVSRPDDTALRVRRVFSATAAGREEFFVWLRKPVPISRPLREEMVVKMVFLGVHNIELLIARLKDRQREYVRRLARLQRPKRSPPVSDPMKRIAELAKDVFRFREEAELRWIEHCLVQLGAEAASDESVQASKPRKKRRGA
jgi:DNA-binding PadR family transcriptional regulator